MMQKYRDNAMIKVKKRTFARHADGKTPMINFVLYVKEREPVLLMRMLESIGNDVWDRSFDIISYDNGKTWGERKLVFQREPVGNNGEISYTGAAAIYHSETDELIVITDYKFEPGRISTSLDYPYRLYITRGNPEKMAGVNGLVMDFGMKQGILLSFCHAFVDSSGLFIFPAMNPVIDSSGRLVSLGYKTKKGSENIMRDYWEPRIIIGEIGRTNEISWSLA